MHWLSDNDEVIHLRVIAIKCARSPKIWNCKCPYECKVRGGVESTSYVTHLNAERLVRYLLKNRT